ncbi:hypothetical protein M0802_016629 [Mischocyttarus mexicanus]|nr:hypothetical protein M0802_016629 [Mischocyttarus mexicanus]
MRKSVLLRQRKDCDLFVEAYFISDQSVISMNQQLHCQFSVYRYRILLNPRELGKASNREDIVKGFEHFLSLSNIKTSESANRRPPRLRRSHSGSIFLFLSFISFTQQKV